MMVLFYEIIIIIIIIIKHFKILCVLLLSQLTEFTIVFDLHIAHTYIYK